jgi:hypothetical protein
MGGLGHRQTLGSDVQEFRLRKLHGFATQGK